jgi:hypothetical protein
MLQKTLLSLSTALALVTGSHAQVRIVDDLPGAFLDIAATGTPLALSDDGEANFVSTIGNSLIPAGQVRIGANGGARFGTSPIPTLGPDLAAVNTSLPSSGAFAGRQALLPFWDDLVLTNSVSGDGEVYVEEVGDVLVIQWDDVRVASATPFDRMTFQVQVLANGPVRARFVYRTIGLQGIASGGGAGATIGYQGPNGTSAQHSLDARTVVTNGTVLSLIEGALPTMIVDSLPGTFLDIAATGTQLALSDDSEIDVTTGVRNALLLGDTVRIGSNGGLKLLGASGVLNAQNTSIPSPLAFEGATSLLPFWDDIAPESQGAVPGAGRIYVQELGDRLVVQWDDVGFFQAPNTERATFQVQVFHERDLAAQFLYRDVEGVRAGSGASATIGYQAGGLGVDVQHSFNAASLSNGAVLSLFAFGTEVGTPYCAVAPNSSGDRALLRGLGTSSIAANDLRLDARLLPPNAASFFLVGTNAGFVPNAGGSQGNLCLGGQIGRGVGGTISNSGAARTVSTSVDLLALPSPTGLFAATAGQTLSFQCWFRDSAAGSPTSNLSNGLQLQVKP